MSDLPTPPAHPSLYEINTRVWLRALSAQLGSTVTLANVPDEELERIAALRCDWVWLLSVWQTGEAGRTAARTRPDKREEYRRVLPDLDETRDVCGSGFAIVAYVVSDELGGPAALASFRQRLAAKGIRLMLDFVPNHSAPDHAWVESNPDYFVAGTEDDIQRTPGGYLRVRTASGPRILAHGRDPYFPAWPDTLQLDYGNPALQEARIGELLDIASQCDGVRCDMAMLILPDVFKRTWGIDMPPFWPRAIETVRKDHPSFVFIAEVYWDLEWTLQQQGFDHCYDKRLYDRLCGRYARPVREHLAADPAYQAKLVRFIENHDEPRAAEVFPLPAHQAAAVITYFGVGMRLFHQGQLDGFKVHIPMELCRGPDEAADPAVQSFYQRLLQNLTEPVFRHGHWLRLEPFPAWAGNWSCDSFVAYAWQSEDGDRALVVVNYDDNQGQCHLRLPFADLARRKVRLTDRMGKEVYDRDGSSLLDPGLYVDLGAWGYNVFSVGEAS
jgi:Glycosidases